MLHNTIWIVLAIIAVVCMGSACEKTDEPQKHNRTAADGEQANLGTASPTVAPIAGTMKGLRELMVDVAAYHVCDRLEGRFLTLSAGGGSARGGSDPSNGVLRIKECTASQVDPRHLRVEVSGEGWQWISPTREQLGATFKVDENVKYFVNISVVGTLDMAYDQDDHIATVWFIPTQPVDVKFRVIGDVQVETESLWASIVGTGASLFGKSPEKRFEKGISEHGVHAYRTKLSHGLSFIIDLCTGQQFTKFGTFPAGKTPDEAMSTQGKSFLVNGRGRLYNEAILMSGPFKTNEPIVAHLDVTEGGGVYAALVCEEDAKRIASAYVRNNALPQIQPLEEQRILRQDNPVRLKVGADVSCPVVLVMRPIEEQEVPVTYDYTVFHQGATQKQLVKCGQNYEAAEQIEDVETIVTADKKAFIGRRVELSDVKVQSVTGDRTFWIGSSPAQQMLVVLKEEKTPETPTEGRYNVNPGQVLTIIGEIKELPDPKEAQEEWKLDAQDLKTLKEGQTYLLAEKIEILQRQ